MTTEPTTKKEADEIMSSAAKWLDENRLGVERPASMKLYNMPFGTMLVVDSSGGGIVVHPEQQKEEAGAEFPWTTFIWGWNDNGGITAYYCRPERYKEARDWAEREGLYVVSGLKMETVEGPVFIDAKAREAE